MKMFALVVDNPDHTVITDFARHGRVATKRDHDAEAMMCGFTGLHLEVNVLAQEIIFESLLCSLLVW